MAKTSSGKGPKPHHQATRKSGGKPKREGEAKPTEAAEPKKPTRAKTAKSAKSLLDMDQAVLSVLNLDPGIQFTPKQIKSLLSVLILHESQVAKSLESLHAKSKIAQSAGGTYSLTPAREGVRTTAARAAAPAPVSPGLDLRSAILAALCLDPKGPIPSAEVRRRVEILTGLAFDPFDVLNRLIRLAWQGTIRRDGDLFSRECP